MITQTKRELFPDPFDEPNRYWRMIMNCPIAKEWEKRKRLRLVGLNFDVEPVELGSEADKEITAKLAELRRVAV